MAKKPRTLDEWVTIILTRITKTDKECWEYPRRNRSGYGHVFIGGVKGGNVSVHRIMYEKFIGLIPDGRIVCHRCDNPACCNPDHLFLGTHQDNSDDMVKKGRSFRTTGEKSGMCKLSKSQVLEIRRSSESGVVVAKRYGVSKSTVSMIRNMKSRKEE